jgi:hypothetical protein
MAALQLAALLLGSILGAVAGAAAAVLPVELKAAEHEALVVFTVTNNLGGPHLRPSSAAICDRLSRGARAACPAGRAARVVLSAQSFHSRKAVPLCGGAARARRTAGSAPIASGHGRWHSRGSQRPNRFAAHVTLGPRRAQERRSFCSVATLRSG